MNPSVLKVYFIIFVKVYFVDCVYTGVSGIAYSFFRLHKNRQDSNSKKNAEKLLQISLTNMKVFFCFFNY